MSLISRAKRRSMTQSEMAQFEVESGGMRGVLVAFFMDCAIINRKEVLNGI